MTENAGRGATPTRHWFATAPAAPEDFLTPEPRMPGLVIHAKTMGTNYTACVLNATSWTKLWDISFEAVAVTRRCHLCAAQIARVTAADLRQRRQAELNRIA